MKKASLLILLFTAMIVSQSFSQTIKFRLDFGNSMNFSSYYYKLFSEYYQKPIATSEYTYRKLTRNSLLSYPHNFGFALEYDYKNRNHFTLGYTFMEIISLKDRVLYNTGSNGVDSGSYRYVNPWSSSMDLESPLHKFSLTYSRDYGKGRFKVSPLIGISYAWVMQNPTPFDTLASRLIGPVKDDMFPSSDFYIKTAATFGEHTSTLMLSLGTNFRFHSKKRELFALRVYYEQGFRVMAWNHVEVYRNGNNFTNNYIFSRGSALYVKVSIPIPLYNLDKHKKK